jgi:protease-4
VEAGLKKAAGIAETDKIKFVAIHDYMKTAAESNSGKTDKVAVIIAEGDIVDGKGARGMIGGDAIAAELRKVRLDKNVKAVVLRINSGGGSALASDIMWREVELLKKAKPVIASMSDYAASGGYYMAMACNTIVARPNTITGSIGVFGLTFNAQELMNSKLGVTFDNVKTGQYADLGDASRPLTDSERRILQNGVERIYKDFTGKVAAGRRLPLDSVLRIAGGRVWTGTQAKAIGLVDVLGSYEDAVELAAKQAKLTKGDYELKFYPKKETIWEVLAGSEDLIRAQVLKSELGEFYPIYQQTKQLLHLRGIQARMPFQLRIN